MNRIRRHIFLSYLLLAVFVNGQSIIYFHRHTEILTCKERLHVAGINHKHPIEVNNCFLCGGMMKNLLLMPKTFRVGYYYDASLIEWYKEDLNYFRIKKHTKSRAPPKKDALRRTK